MEYLVDFFEELTAQQISKSEKEREITEIQELSRILNSQEIGFGANRPIQGEGVEILKNYCLDKGFVIEDSKRVSKWKYHFTRVNVYMIWNRYAVIENIRHIQRGRKWHTQRKNYFVIWIENDTLKWKPISGNLYFKMRRDFLHKRNPIDRFLKWSESGKSVEVWDFPPVENYSIKRII